MKKPKNNGKSKLNNFSKEKKAMKKFFKELSEIFLLLLTGKSKQAVDDGICDFSGQGRDKYGN